MRERNIALALLAAAAVHATPRVIVIGVDGLSSRGLERANKPNIAALMSSGAWTMRARAVLPIVSNWASMITGADAAQHGVISNNWTPEHHTIEPACKGPSGIFPTVFLLLRQQRPSSNIAIFHEAEDFARLVEPGVPTALERGSNSADTVKRAISYLGAHKPDLMFINLVEPDPAGHKYGYSSAEYLQGIEDVDRLVGELMQALDARKLRDSTVVLLTSNHGGRGRTHEGVSMEELEIPWIVSGPAVRAGEIKTPVNQFDTAATVAYVLELQTPLCWIGRAVPGALRPRAAVRGLPEPGKRPPPSTIRMK